MYCIHVLYICVCINGQQYTVHVDLVTVLIRCGVRRYLNLGQKAVFEVKIMVSSSDIVWGYIRELNWQIFKLAILQQLCRTKIPSSHVVTPVHPAGEEGYYTYTLFSFSSGFRYKVASDPVDHRTCKSEVLILASNWQMNKKCVYVWGRGGGGERGREGEIPNRMVMHVLTTFSTAFCVVCIILLRLC